MKTAIELITQERAEQLKKHGFTIQYDIKFNSKRKLAYAARSLILYFDLNNFSEDKILLLKPYHWDDYVWIKMCRKSYEERLIIAGALIAAEYDRIKENT